MKTSFMTASVSVVWCNGTLLAAKPRRQVRYRDDNSSDDAVCHSLTCTAHGLFVS